jgi:hypothetical protein
MNARNQQTNRDNALIGAATPVHGATLPADRLAVMLFSVRLPFYGLLHAGSVVEIVGDAVRLDNGRTLVRTLAIGGVVRLVDLTEPYEATCQDMMVSPYTGQLVPMGGVTAGRAKREMAAQQEMVR